MKNQSTLILGTVVVVLGLFGAGAYYYKQQQKTASNKQLAANLERLVRSYSVSKGPRNAPVTIVEFLDPECEACAAFYPAVKQVLDLYPSKTRLVVRYFPLHQNSKYAAKMLEIMRARGMYWETLETFFSKQTEWAQHHDPKPELLKTYVAAMGLSEGELERGLNDVEYETIVNQDQQDAQALGIRGTPTFFVNGKQLENLGFQQLKDAVEAAIIAANAG